MTILETLKDKYSEKILNYKLSEVLKSKIEEAVANDKHFVFFSAPLSFFKFIEENENYSDIKIKDSKYDATKEGYVAKILSWQ